ncbi:FECH, partial [Cordylochernes scorpioides]
MGGPSTLKEVENFLCRLFTDKDIMSLPSQNLLGPLIAKRRTPKIAEKYAEIGGGSQIRKWTETQGKLLVEKLDQLSPATAPHKYYVGFRYAPPLTEDALEEISKDNPERIVAFSQYAQYSCSTTGSSLNHLAKLLKNSSIDNSKWSIIDRWATHPGLASVFANLIKEELQHFPESVRDKVVILFSAHSLPMKVVTVGDPYPAEVAATVHNVMDQLEYSHPYRLVWQSKVGPLAWLPPATDESMRGLVRQGRRNMIMVPITFVNEHIETLHEMDIEYGQDLAKEIGVEQFRRVKAPNDHPLFIQTLADVVKKHLDSKLPYLPQLTMRCPGCCKESYKDIMSLPSQNLLGPLIAKRRTPKIAEKYAEIGGGSPIRKWTETQGKLLVEKLDQLSPATAPHKYYLGFRYAPPLIEDALEEISKDNPERIIAFSQYPQYSCSTTGSSLNHLAKLLKNSSIDNSKWSIIDRWATHPGLASVFANLIKEELQHFPESVRDKVVILFSAHSLPMKVVTVGDPYPAEVAATVHNVMDQLEYSHPYRLVWQSKVGRLAWLPPRTDESMRGLVRQGRRNMIMVPITFVNEHIETLHEMDIEYGQDLAKEIGVEQFRRVKAPNDHPLFIQTLADVVKKHLDSKLPYLPQLTMRCPGCCKES